MCLPLRQVKIIQNLKFKIQELTLNFLFSNSDSNGSALKLGLSKHKEKITTTGSELALMCDLGKTEGTIMDGTAVCQGQFGV